MDAAVTWRCCTISAATQAVTAATANTAAANEIHATRARCGFRRGGGLMGLSALTGLAGGFGAAGTSVPTVTSWVDSPLAGPAAREARRRARGVIVGLSATAGSITSALDQA